MIHSKSWYFISMPTPLTNLPSDLTNQCTMYICHHAMTGSCEGLSVIMGFCKFDRPVSQSYLYQLVGPHYQWIPRSIAHLYSIYLNVNFAAWSTDKFDIDQFLCTQYPWDEVSAIIRRLVQPLPIKRFESTTDIWPDD